jgi:8-oxo-dGTP pyrophosphatase MutT (NUDIX family)
MKILHILSPLLSNAEVVLTRSSATSQGLGLPANLTDVYARHYGALSAKVAAGNIFDGPVAVLRGWHFTDGGLHLEVQSSTYVPMTATRLTYVEALKTGILDEADVSAIPLEFGACLCACVVVLTADNQIMTLRRAANLSNPGTVALGLGEVLDPVDFDHGRLALHAAGARALREELGVTLTPEQTAEFIKPMYLTRGRECGSWVFVVVADLRQAGADFSAERILTKAQTAQDAWESDAKTPIPFDRGSLDAFLQANAGRLGMWADELVELLSVDLLEGTPG